MLKKHLTLLANCAGLMRERRFIAWFVSAWCLHILHMKWNPGVGYSHISYISYVF